MTKRAPNRTIGSSAELTAIDRRRNKKRKNCYDPKPHDHIENDARVKNRPLSFFEESEEETLEGGEIDIDTSVIETD